MAIIIFLFTDLDEEKIHLSKSATISLSELPSQVPSDAARYHLYIFKHTHEGDHTESIGIYQKQYMY